MGFFLLLSSDPSVFGFFFREAQNKTHLPSDSWWNNLLIKGKSLGLGRCFSSRRIGNAFGIGLELFEINKIKWREKIIENN